MNQTQRKFLIDRIESRKKESIESLRRSKPEKPSISGWILAACIADQFELKSIDSIKEIIRQRALNSNGKDNWLSRGSSFTSTHNGVNFQIEEIFEIPSAYREKFDAWVKAVHDIDEEIQKIYTQAEGLIVRIQLASNKTLERMINEVDDMGDISLMDTKIKEISISKDNTKLIT